MKDHENDIELIERFLDKTLSEDEVDAFHQRLEEDPEFAQLVALRKALPDHWRKTAEYEKTREEVGNALKLTEHKGIYQLNMTVLSIAASIVILVGIAIALIFGVGDRLFSEDNQPIVQQNDTVLTPEIDIPEQKAKMAVYSSNSIQGIQLIYPKEGDSIKKTEMITFKWEYQGDSATTFYLILKESGRIVFKASVKPRQQSFTLPTEIVRPGVFSWYLATDTLTRGFKIY